MSINLLESIKEQLSTTVIDKISNFLGTNRGNTSNAISAAIPTILAFFTKKSQTEKGAEELINIASNEKLNSLFKGKTFTEVFDENRDIVTNAGSSILADLLGDKEDELNKEIAKFANIDKEVSSGILASITPMIMNQLGSAISKGGLNSSNLSKLFDKEKETIFSAIPSGLASLGTSLGLSDIASSTASTVSGVAENAKETVNSTAEKISSTAEKVSQKVEPQKGGFMKWLLPLLGLIAALLLIWYLMKQYETDKVNDTNSIENVESIDDNLNSEQTFIEYSFKDGSNEIDDGFGSSLRNTNGEIIAIDEEKHKLDNNGFVIDNEGNKVLNNENKEIKIISLEDDNNLLENENIDLSESIGEVYLINDVKIHAYPGGIEEQLINFINSEAYKNSNDEQLKESWFDFDDLNFEFGTTKLTKESKRQIDNIVAILKAYPKVKIKIGAYTDKKGDDTTNLKLSQERANAVKSALEKDGVGAQVTAAEGYGEKFANVDENASDEEREADRKTSIRLVK